MASHYLVTRVISHETRRRWSLLQESLAAAFSHPTVSSDTCSVFINIGTLWRSSFTYNFQFLFCSFVVLSACVWQQFAINYLKPGKGKIWRYFSIQRFPAQEKKTHTSFEGFQSSPACPSDETIVRLRRVYWWIRVYVRRAQQIYSN